jgi:AraC-like DNA-binding protein
LGFVAIWVVNLNSFAVFMIVRKPEWCAYTASIYALTAFLFLNLLMFFLLSNPDMYYVSTKYKNTKLKEEEKKDYLQRLSSFMETNKPFFNPEISLESLAIEISMNPRILSQIINETFNKTFKGYILEFRIKESMQILADSRYNHLTILEILYKVGFNTKSTFNNQFKIYTNLTPQEYRSKFMSEKKAVLQYS